MTNQNIPKVSVIVPVFNMEKTVGRCLDSVLNQDYQNLEIILIDDGSTDNSSTICEQYSNKYLNIVFKSRPNKGVSQTYSEGIKLSTGDFVIFVDSDDYIEKGMLSSLIQHQSVSNADIVQSGIVFLKEDGTLIKSWKPVNRVIVSNQEMVEDYFVYRTINRTFAGSLFRKTLFNNVTFPDKALSIDIQVVPYLLLNCKVMEQYNDCFYDAVMYQESVSRGVLTDRMYSDKYKCANLLRHFFSTYYPNLEDFMYYINISISMLLATKILIGHAAVNDPEEKFKECRQIFNQNYRLFLKSDVYNKITLKNNVHIRLFRMSPKLYAFLYKTYSNLLIK